MEISSKYEPLLVEDKWYQDWLSKKYFKSVPDNREPYTIVIPPPNVTGVLHMGHMLNNTIQDLLIRRARMLGKNACWVPGTDHASIATEAKVVAMLKEKGMDKKDLSRDEFLKHAWEWKEKYGGIILKQLEKLGASCDWDRTRFTMEEDLSEAVIEVFIDLYNKGKIYRGIRMVNWDPKGLTAVSDEEVIYKEVNSKLFYVRYPIEGSDEYITIATTRPETILGDTAVCVHPEDERYKHLKGKYCLIPMVNRRVPIIFDDYIDIEFGTGALKVTPAHDINDYNLGIKHNLEVIDTIANDGSMSAAAQFYVGEDRFAVRKKIAADLEQMGNLVKVEDIKNKVGYSERTDAVIEPKLSMQWFLQMEEICKPALENVLNDNIKLIPEKFINTYKHWMENVHDWCISRQLWWGQRIPAWYDDKGNIVVGKTLEEAQKLFAEKFPESNLASIKQDEDVLDTWFSSWLWPISVFDGFKNPDNADINYYYPTNDLVTAPEILFFWVARMIIAGYEYRKDKPFSNVYLTGIVRDKQGRKMSKSLGNSPDPLDLIAQYGADAVRVGMLLSSPAGNDLLFDIAYCEQGRNFANKIWNAFRLIKSWDVSDKPQTVNHNQIAIDWMNARFNQVLEQLEDAYAKYRISDALMIIYKCIWDDFCAWYLEMIKPAYVDGQASAIDAATYNATLNIFEKLMQIAHPLMPFITEEIWHLLKERGSNESIMISKMPQMQAYDEKLLQQAENTFELISSIRDARIKNQLKNKETVKVYYQSDSPESFMPFAEQIKSLTHSETFETFNNQANISNQFVIKCGQFFIDSGKEINKDEELNRLQKELDYLSGFIKSVESKLSNERFVQNAPSAILEKEQQKLKDGLQQIEALKQSIAGLQ